MAVFSTCIVTSDFEIGALLIQPQQIIFNWQYRQRFVIGKKPEMDTLWERMDTAHEPISSHNFPWYWELKKILGAYLLRVASILIKSVFILSRLVRAQPCSCWLGEGAKTTYGMLELFTKIPYCYAALTSRCGNVIARTHHRFENSRQSKLCLNSLTQSRVSSLTEREDSKVLLQAQYMALNLGPKAAFLSDQKISSCDNKEMAFLLCKDTSNREEDGWARVPQYDYFQKRLQKVAICLQKRISTLQETVEEQI